MKWTAPICVQYISRGLQGHTATYETGEIIPCLALKLLWVAESLDISATALARKRKTEMLAYSMFEMRFGGFAFNTTKINIGTKVSAFSSLCRFRIRPMSDRIRQCRYESQTKVLTKNDLATIQNTDQFVSRSLVVVDLQQL